MQIQLAENFLMKSFILNKIFPSVLSLVFIFLLWEIFARAFSSSLVLPFPRDVFKTLFRLLHTKNFYAHFGFTFLRVVKSFLISITIGFVLGFFSGNFLFLKIFFSLPLSLVRVTPVVSFILLAVFWFPSNDVPIFVCVLMTLPIVVSNIAESFSHRDEKLLEMAKLYHFSKRQIFFYITLPHSKPFFLSACVSVFSLSWKVVAAGEVLSLPHFGIGSLLQTSSMHLNSNETFALTILLILASFALEKIFHLLFKKWKTI